MAKFSFNAYDQFDAIRKQFDTADKEIINICKKSLYVGAGLIADEVHNATVPHGNLVNALDLSKMRTNTDGASINLGFGGYDEDGVAYAVKANVLESGRSGPNGVMKATHFFSRAFNKGKQQFNTVVLAKFNEEFEKLMEE